MRPSVNVLRFLLGLGAVYHIVLGATALIFRSHTGDLARRFFQFNLSNAPEVQWILNPFSAYLLAFGALLAITATNPGKYRPFVFVAVGLYSLRFVERIWFLLSGDEALKVAMDPLRQGVHLLVVALMAVAMAMLAGRLRDCA